jgi:drug/metabolite transporter (DMT)-like permease
VSRSTGKSNATGYILYFTAASLWALNGTISKIILLSVGDPSRVSQLRNTAAFLILFVVVLLVRRSGFRLKRSEIGNILVYSLGGITITQYAYFEAISRMPIGVSLLIEFTAPIFIVLWVRYGRKQQVKPTIWLGLIMAIGGLALVGQVWSGLKFDALGLIFSFIAMTSLIFYYIFGERASLQRDAISLMMWGFFCSSAFWAIKLSWFEFPWEKLTVIVQPFPQTEMQMPVWVLALYMIIGGTVLPFTLVIQGMKYLGAAGASLMGMMEPLVAFVIAWIVLGESLNAIQIIGGLVMLTGVYIAELARVSKKPEVENMEAIVPS